mgnify:CR=1 FL=1
MHHAPASRVIPLRKLLAHAETPERAMRRPPRCPWTRPVREHDLLVAIAEESVADVVGSQDPVAKHRINRRATILKSTVVSDVPVDLERVPEAAGTAPRS